ncbi:MAG: NUDIX domain-containing protein, partial [Spirochaetales bacterium]|nr:NUDIX domain-containing protein [Candidatus Physcosoma equi]
MIHKKKGLGTGYIIAPGGHVELEETSMEAAIRETKEETGLDCADLEEMGTLHFQFKDGLRMLG